MRTLGRIWCVVLAAGDGTRMRSLSQDANGKPLPKQFWKFDGKRSLLQVALERARGIAGPRRVVAIVAAKHRGWWQKELAGLPAANIVVQPQNKGTAAGVLLPLLHIARRDPQARVLVIPADHGVGDELPLRDTMLQALLEAERRPQELMLLGIEPDGPDPELGYVVPARPYLGMSRPVVSFFEKPRPDMAAELITQGALWNAFIMAANIRTWLELFEASAVELLQALQETLSGAHLEQRYATLPSRDFSRDVLWKSTGRLRLVAVPECGWTDLGTPERYRRWVETVTDGTTFRNALSA